MKILGNALATHQAVFVAALALQMFPQHAGELNPDACVKSLLANTLTSENSLLLQVDAGWLMCGKSQAAWLQADQALAQQLAGYLAHPEHQFHGVRVAAGHGSDCIRVHLMVSQHVTIESLVKMLEVEPYLIAPATGNQPCRIDCEARPCLLPLQTRSRHKTLRPVFLAWTRGQCFALSLRSPDLFQQLEQVCHFASLEGGANAVCHDVVGNKISNVDDIWGAVLVSCRNYQAPVSPAFLSPAVLADCYPEIGASHLCLRVAEHVAAEMYLSFPTHLLSALGWQTAFGKHPMSPSEQLCIQVRPQSDTPVLSVSVLRHWLRLPFFAGMLRGMAPPGTPQQLSSSSVLVEVQLTSSSFWHGPLPARVTFEELEACWAVACHASGCDPVARVYSGPHPVPPSSTLARCGDEVRVLTREVAGARCLVVSVMPACVGGGTKDHRVQELKARLAQVCLEQGYSLPESNKICATLMSQLPLPKLQQALDSKPPSEQWRQLRAIFLAQGIKEPSAGEITARQVQKVQGQARRRQLFQDSLVARDFALAGGFFVNEDLTPATVLTKIVPDACGIVLMDKAVASEVLLTTSLQPKDELAIIVLGHECPHPPSCTRKLRFPAMALGAEGHVLLAGCMHNIGQRSIGITVKDIAKVDLTDLVPCTFHTYLDELSAEPSWQDVVQSPVKLMLGQFRQLGILLPTAQPWARSFRSQGKPTTPALSDQVFNAMIPKDQLPQALKASGHNGVYLVPRNDQGRIQGGWSIIWLTSCKADLARTALGVSEQCGLVRSKDRLGLRVADADYEAVFKRLRPDQVLRSRVAVQLLYCISPLPIGTTEQSLVQWATGQSWPLRVLKALGPTQWLVGAEKPPPLGGSHSEARPFSLHLFQNAPASARSSRQAIAICPLPAQPRSMPTRSLLLSLIRSNSRIHGLPNLRVLLQFLPHQGLHPVPYLNRGPGHLQVHGS